MDKNERTREIAEEIAAIFSEIETSGDIEASVSRAVGSALEDVDEQVAHAFERLIGIVDAASTLAARAILRVRELEERVSLLEGRRSSKAPKRRTDT